MYAIRFFYESGKISAPNLSVIFLRLLSLQQVMRLVFESDCGLLHRGGFLDKSDYLSRLIGKLGGLIEFSHATSSFL